MQTKFIQTYLNAIINDSDIIVTNEPARIRNVGAPDYSITRKELPVGYIEAKDVGGKDLEGYQPAQKWLKDRVGRELSRTDLKHYNKIINALVKTNKIMKEIDEVFEI